MSQADGFSLARLGRMHDVMAGHVERATVPDVATLVSRRGEVYVDAIGMTALGSGEPMRAPYDLPNHLDEPSRSRPRRQ
jgi:hypothetical protein